MTPPPPTGGPRGPRLSPADASLAGALASGRRIPGAPVGPGLTALAWVAVRAFGAAEAPAPLARALRGSVGGDELSRFVALVGCADASDTTPARTAAEFAWRHPEVARAEPSVAAAPGVPTGPTAGRNPTRGAP